MDYRGDIGIGFSSLILPLHEACPKSRPQETVELLQAKVSALDLAVLDQVEARLQVLSGGQIGLQVAWDSGSPRCPINLKTCAFRVSWEK